MPGKLGPVPPHLIKRFRPDPRVEEIQRLLDGLQLHTVCNSAMCPNRNECFAKGTATFMILGDVCTRDCRFCGVPSGEPSPPDPNEPDRIAKAVEMMGLRHVVITSVTRDDLSDGGAEQFAGTVRAIRARCTEVVVELLVPDFKGQKNPLHTVLDSGIDILNHNVETVPRLYPEVRPGADYRTSLEVLRYAGEIGDSILRKSGMMVGLGETPEEVAEVIEDLARIGCRMLTIGQYLRPTPHHVPIAEYVSEEQFQSYEQIARLAGFAYVASGPFVRSSYNAAELYGGANGIE